GMAELEINRPINLDDYGLESDDFTTFKQLRKGNTRFFINNQSISKKMMGEISGGFVKHLSHKDFSDFDKKALLEIVDTKVGERDSAHAARLEVFKEHFSRFEAVKKELVTILDEEKRLVELREFAEFEVKKIDTIAPKIGEDDELDSIKKRLSKKEKIQSSIQKAEAIYELEFAVSDALSALDIESSFFDDTMNELRAHFETADAMMEELDELDIESVLDRMEAIGELKRRYGSIEEALAYRDSKSAELLKYENFDEHKVKLQTECEQLEQDITEEADAIHVARIGVMQTLETELNTYLKALYLRHASFMLDFAPMDKTGVDKIDIQLEGTQLQQISSGEFNRLRLAILAIKSALLTQKGGILILDEIDANLSGEESMSVAHVLTELAQNYQIFAISHQPQLTSQAHQHFLVYKEGNESLVKPLAHEERIEEIARMISGDQITSEARQFAMQLRKSS
ncbi:MAG: ATPase, partial [Thiovulaceae bacterium]|nr:ATPase [Sulfurimonadaceae bacterium]